MAQLEQKFVIEKLENGDTKGGKAFKDWFNSLPPGRYVITGKRYRKQRSLKQNAVLHWYIQEIADETGMDKDIIKEVLKKKFLTTAVLDQHGQVIVDETTGEVLEYVRETSSLTTEECLLFTDSIRQWALEFLNMTLPLPNEQSEIF